MDYLIFILSFILMSVYSPPDFKQEQLKYSRVREAYAAKESTLKNQYQLLQLNLYSQQTFIRVFKQEKKLEVWSKDSQHSSYVLIKTWNICAASGNPGPKRKQGDNQVPEGVYSIDRFNPVSSFYLSLGLNYPNASDRILSDANCVSIGCMAMTDDVIKEIYVICTEARQNGQHKIPVHVFPFKMTEANMNVYCATYPQHKGFWTNLKTVYTYWEENHNLPIITTTDKGYYLIQE